MALNGWDQETFYARWRLGVCLLAGGAEDEGCGVLWQAWAERPGRAEPLASLAEHYRLRALWPLGWQACDLAFRYCGAQPAREGLFATGSADELFVHADVTEWRMAYEGSIAAWYVAELDHRRRLGEYVLAGKDVPSEIRVAVEANNAFTATPCPNAPVGPQPGCWP